MLILGVLHLRFKNLLFSPEHLPARMLQSSLSLMCVGDQSKDIKDVLSL